MHIENEIKLDFKVRASSILLTRVSTALRLLDPLLLAFHFNKSPHFALRTNHYTSPCVVDADRIAGSAGIEITGTSAAVTRVQLCLCHLM